MNVRLRSNIQIFGHVKNDFSLFLVTFETNPEVLTITGTWVSTDDELKDCKLKDSQLVQSKEEKCLNESRVW